MYPDWHSKGSVVVWGLPETVLDLGVIEDTDDGSSMTSIDYPESNCLQCMMLMMMMMMMILMGAAMTVSRVSFDIRLYV